MERDTSEVTESGADQVSEALERLEVADRLEDLRRHIDGLIERLSSPDPAEVEHPRGELPAGLEGQLEHLGNKVESASCLLAELTDVLEAQTQRIETIEQQLGDPDLMASLPVANPGQSDVPRFSMRPPQAAVQMPEPSTATTAELLGQLRTYLEQRFDRLDNAIAEVEQRLAGLRRDSEGREREVRELEERLLILVESSPSAAAAGERVAAVPSPASAAPAHTSGAPTAPASVAQAHASGAPVAVPPTSHAPTREPAAAWAAVAPRHLPLPTSPPPQMPLFVQALAHAERRLRRARPRMTGPTMSVSAESFLRGRQVKKKHASTEQCPPTGDAPVSTSRRASAADAEAPPPAAGRKRAEPATSAGERAQERLAAAERDPEPAARSATAMTRAVKPAAGELERLVERKVKLVREFLPGARQTQGPWKAHPTILVVDDAPDALKLLSIYLSRTGYNVVTALSAEDCLAKLRHHAIDAVVLDAKLQGASGEHVCRVLRGDEGFGHRRHVPVIIYTAYPEEFPVEVCARWQADEYVEKSGDLLPLVRALVRLTSQDNRASIS